MKNLRFQAKIMTSFAVIMAPFYASALVVINANISAADALRSLENANAQNRRII